MEYLKNQILITKVSPAGSSQTEKRCSPIDPFTWTCKCRTTS